MVNEKFVVLTISDTCGASTDEDESGPELVKCIREEFPSATIQNNILPDDEDAISQSLINFCDVYKAHVIITTGGTGFTHRDVTPEATRKIIDKLADGISVALLVENLKITPMAMTSRLVSGIRKNTLIINFPGSVNAVIECFRIIKPVLLDSINLLNNVVKCIKETDENIQNVAEEYKVDVCGCTHSRHGEGSKDRIPRCPMIEDKEETKSIINETDKIRQNVAEESKVDECSLGEGSKDRSSLCSMIEDKMIVKEDDCRHSNSCQEKGFIDRSSPYPMIEVNEAMKIILNEFKNNHIGFDTKKILNSMGYVVYEDVVADAPFPAFDASIKDGYACISADGKSDRIVRYEVAARDDPTITLKRGECAYVNTDAAVPKGANCVVQIENTKLIKHDDSKEHTIKILVGPRKGQNIKKIGWDIKKSQIVIPKGTEIGAAEIGLLASLGRTKVRVFTRPTIGIVSIGNELQSINTPILKKGQVRDSNKSMLMSLFKDIYNVYDYGIINDDPVEMKDTLTRAFNLVDILITTGGVSLRGKNYLKPVLTNDLGANIHFNSLNMNPGKPTTFASLTVNDSKKFVFALPGNPVSALVISQLLVIPSLRFLSGIIKCRLIKLNVLLGERVDLDRGPYYARGVINYDASLDCPIATLTGNHISSRLTNPSGADVLVMLPGSDETKQTFLDNYQLVQALLLKS